LNFLISIPHDRSIIKVLKTINTIDQNILEWQNAMSVERRNTFLIDVSTVVERFVPSIGFRKITTVQE